MTIFSLQWIMVYPVVGQATQANYPLNHIKGKICTKTNIHEFYEEKENIMFSIKPKVTIITLSKRSDEICCVLVLCSMKCLYLRYSAGQCQPGLHQSCSQNPPQISHPGLPTSPAGYKVPHCPHLPPHPLL